MLPRRKHGEKSYHILCCILLLISRVCLCSELLAYTYHHLYGINCTGLRFFTVYGPRGRPDMAPYKFISRVFNGETIQQFGDGTTSRDYTYIDDIVSGVIASIDRPLGCEVLQCICITLHCIVVSSDQSFCSFIDQVINLGNGRPFMLKDFISLVETCVGRAAVIEVLPCQQGDVDRTCADISKAKQLLGYSPSVPFEEGIRRTAEWYRTAHEQGMFEPVTVAAKAPEVTTIATTTTSVEDRNRGDSYLSMIDIDADKQSDSSSGSSSSPNKSSSPRKSSSSSSFFKKNFSDVELSSFVSKAVVQVKERVRKSFRSIV